MCSSLPQRRQGTEMSSNLNGQHALVTGAGQGIGEAIARQLLAQGAKVTVLGRKPESLQKLVDAHPDQCQMVLADVADEAQIKAAFAQAVQAQGAINILVNNAGIAGPTGGIDAISDAEWQAFFHSPWPAHSHPLAVLA